MQKRVLTGIDRLSSRALVLTFERGDLEFIPGQHLSVGVEESVLRPYSIYSGTGDDYLSILVKVVDDGVLTPRLSALEIGDELRVGIPRGHFVIQPEMSGKRLAFIANGSGVAPFHSFVKSHSGLNYQMIYGVSCAQEAYGINDFTKERVVLCTSQESSDFYHGRVTTYLEFSDLSYYDYFFMCGSYQMIDDVYDILERKGISSEKITVEGYY